MFTCETKFTVEMQKQLDKNKKILGIILTIIGSLGLLIYISSAFWENEPTWIDWLLVFAVPFALGIIFLVAIQKNLKSVSKLDITNVYEFNMDFMTISTIKYGENIGSVKLWYKEFLKVKETKDYLFIYNSPVSAFPVDKKNLKEADLIILRGIFISNKIKISKLKAKNK